MNLLAPLTLLAQATVPAVEKDYTLSAGGWIAMLLSVTFVTVLFAWCIWRVFREPPEKVVSPLSIDLPDRDT